MAAHVRQANTSAAGKIAVENIAEQRALEKLDFSREGVAQWRAGQWHEQVLYSLLRPEWEAAR
ncbi:hypothetical protein GCM10027417_02420 [Glutamicibacter endophyticus]